MIHSMTAYAYAECSNARHSVFLEIRGFNHRYLDMRLSVPGSFIFFEEWFSSLLRDRCRRGRVEVKLTVSSSGDSAPTIDPKKAEDLRNMLASIQRDLNLPGEITIDHILEFREHIMPDTIHISDELRDILEKAGEQALEEFIKHRRREGSETVRDITTQLEKITSHFSIVQKSASQIEEHVHKRLRDRFHAVLGDHIPEDRVLAEIAVLLVKHSITEELDRLNNHIEQFVREISSDAAAAKRLDFICQEMNREVNTIASKNITDHIPAQIIEIKNALENIREHLRNLE